jgi:hypothetical protein
MRCGVRVVREKEEKRTNRTEMGKFSLLYLVWTRLKKYQRSKASIISLQKYAVGELVFPFPCSALDVVIMKCD